MIPVSISMVWMILDLSKLKKHDKNLYRFCQLRREMMYYLRNKGLNLSKNDYKEIRLLLDLVNNHIHYFNDHKTGFFKADGTFTSKKRIYKDVRETEEKKVPNNKKIEEFYNSYGNALLSAFLSYNPLFASKIAIIILLELTEVASNYIGETLGGVIKNRMDFYKSFLEWIKSERNKFKAFH